MKHRTPFLSWQLLSAILLGLVMSACSSPTVGSTDSNQGTAQSSATPATKHTGTDQPSGTGGAVGGTSLPSNEVKPLVFNLAYKDADIERDIAQIYTQGSSTFHQYMTPDQLVQKYALSDADLQQVQNWLTQNGYTIVETDPLRSSIKVQGSVATIERTLGIKLKAYMLLNHEFFMQEGTPKLPAALASMIHSIVGLDNFALPQIKPPISFSTQVQNSLAANCGKYGAKQTLTSKKLAAAYQVDQLHQQGLQGQGKTIGIAEFDEPFDPADLATYAACAGIATPKVATVEVDGHVQSGSGQGEAAMDVELIAGLAPQAQLLVYQANTDNVSFAQALVDVFNRVAADHRVQVLSVSYGTGEDSFSTNEQAAVNRSLRTLAAEGISVFISSGDCGAYQTRIPHIAQVAFPASAPYAISVGGTHLQVNDQNVSTSETVWGEDDGTPVCLNQWGSGGGVSQNSDFQRPSWQIGSGTTNKYSGAGSGVFLATLPPVPVSAPNGLRQIPDVAAAAYPNIAVYYKGTWVSSGGTSAAAPIWAAGTLLVDQALQQQGKPLLGSVPEFYRLANQAGSYHPYSDITKGTNLFYPATPGWDYATGWGSPNFNAITTYELTQ